MDAGHPDGDDTAALVTELVATLVRELHRHDPPAVRLDSDLERDLGLDSLALAELVGRLEDRIDAALPAALLRDASTPRDLVAAARSSTRRPQVARAAPQPPPPRPVDRPRQASTLGGSLDWHADAHPDRVHLHVLGDDGESSDVLTYGELRRRARAVAAGLIDDGVAPGDAVALMLPTGVDYFTTFLGIVLAGAAAVPLYPPARPSQLEEHLERQRRILSSSGAVLLVTTGEARRVTRLVGAGAAELRHICEPHELAGPPDDQLPCVRPDDTALLQYTSGSTGSPKGVVLSHRHLLANIEAMAQAARATSEDTFVSWLPLYHDMGLIGAWLGPLHQGAPLVSMSPLAFLARPARWLRAIDAHRATLSAAPNFAYELCLSKIDDDELQGVDLSCWRLAFNGAEAVSPSTVRRFTARFARFGLRPDAMMPVYGLAEAGVGLAFPPIGRGARIDRIRRDELRSAGRAAPAADDVPAGEVTELVACGAPLPGYELRIVDDVDAELPARTEGHVQFRGPSATTGYRGDPDATRRLFHDGWLDTGDLGYVADADLFVTGRAKDLIIRAGRNLLPDEAERAIGEVAGIRRGCVVVFAVPDPAGGTEQLIVLAETRETDPEARRRLRASVVATTVDVTGTPPDDVVLAPPGTVPKTSSGKVRRAETADRYVHGRLHPDRRPPWRQAAHFALAGLPRRWRRSRGRVGRAAFSAYAWMVLVGVALPAAAVVALAPGGARRWAVARGVARLVVRLTGIPVRIGGEAPPAGPAVFVANHSSWVDALVLTAVLPGPLRFVGGEFLRDQHVVGPALRRLGVVFVDRHDRREGLGGAAVMAQLAANGARLVVFPEGGLSTTPGLRPFHLGAFAAAAGAHRPVVPLGIRGTRQVLPPGTRALRRGEVDVTVGEPIVPDGVDWSSRIALRDLARDRVLRASGEVDLDGS